MTAQKEPKNETRSTVIFPKTPIVWETHDPVNNPYTVYEVFKMYFEILVIMERGQKAL